MPYRMTDEPVVAMTLRKHNLKEQQRGSALVEDWD